MCFIQISLLFHHVNCLPCIRHIVLLQKLNSRYLILTSEVTSLFFFIHNEDCKGFRVIVTDTFSQLNFAINLLSNNFRNSF